MNRNIFFRSFRYLILSCIATLLFLLYSHKYLFTKDWHNTYVKWNEGIFNFIIISLKNTMEKSFSDFG